MKKLFLIILLFICFKSFGQGYPLNQSLGTDSTLVISRGGLKGRLINRPFSDTTQANLQRIKFYDGAQIYTNSGGAALWIRDSTRNRWIQFFTGGSGATDSTLYTVGSAGFAVAVDGSLGVKRVRPFNGLYGDSSIAGQVAVKLGGLLTEATTITTTGRSIDFTGTNTSLFIDDLNSDITLTSPSIRLITTPGYVVDTSANKILTRATSGGAIGYTYWPTGSVISNVGNAGFDLAYSGTNNVKRFRDSIFFKLDSAGSFVRGYIDTASMFPLLRTTTYTLNNVGTKYDLAVQGTYNVKRFRDSLYFKIDSSLTNTVRGYIDTAGLFAQIRLSIPVPPYVGYVEYPLYPVNDTTIAVDTGAGRPADKLYVLTRNLGDSLYGSGSSLTATRVGFGSGANLLTGSANFIYNSTSTYLGLGASITPAATFHILKDAVNNSTQAVANGIFLQNTTAPATSTDSLASPPITFSVNGRKTLPTAGSQTVLFKLDALGLSSSSQGKAIFRIKGNTNGGTDTVLFSIDNAAIIQQNLNVQGAKIGPASTTNNSLRFGSGALAAITSGVHDIGIGTSSLNLNTTGSYNVGVGPFSLAANLVGNYNVAIGYQALQASDSSFNTAVGYHAMLTNTVGEQNAAFGANALLLNLSGLKNSALGTASLENNTTGSFNTASGHDAMLQNTTGSLNTSAGWLSWSQNRTGDYNVGIGESSGRSVVNGTSNVAIGASAMYAGYGTQEDTVNNSIALGRGVTTSQSNQMVLGNSDLTQTKILGITYNTPASAMMLIKDTLTNIIYHRAIPTGTGTLTSANNGLTDSSGRVILGGNIYKASTINTNSYTVLFSTSDASVNPLSVSATTGVALNVTSAAGTGISSTVTGGSGVAIQGTGLSGANGLSVSADGTYGGTIQNNGSGIGLSVSADLNLAAEFGVSQGANNANTSVLKIGKNTTGTAASGIGGSIDYYIEDDNGASTLSNQLISVLSNPATASFTSQFNITGIDATATETFMNIQASGVVRVNNLADTLATKAYARSVGGGGGGGTPFLPVTGTGTATGAIVGDLAGNSLTIQDATGSFIFVNPSDNAVTLSNNTGTKSVTVSDDIDGIILSTDGGTQQINLDVSDNAITYAAGRHAFTSTNTTGTGTSASLSLAANSLTSGDGLYVDGNGLTTGTLFTLSTTSTVVNSGVLAAIYSTAANSTASKTVRGEIIHILNTGTTSTNVGLEVIAAGATTNYAARFLRGIVSLGLAGDESGRLQFNGITSGVVTIQPASAAGTYTLTLPTTDGAASEFLQTDGNGVLTWAAASGGATWNAITDPTGTQALTFGDAELTTWANGSNTETFLTITNNSLTTGGVITSTTNSLTTGNLFSGSSTSTTLASGNEIIDVSMSGANGTASIIATGIRSTVTNTGTTNTNIGVYGIASGATYNYGVMSTGIISVNDASIAGGAASHALIVRSLDNTSGNGIIVYPNANYGTNTTYGYSSFVASADYRISVVGNDLELNSARTYIGSTGVPTAKLHFAAGSTSASTAPLKFTAGTNMTTAEAGAVEFDGTNYFVTSSTTRYTVAKTLTATATLNFGSAAAGAALDLTITVTGAAVGDAVYIGVDNASVTADNIAYWGWVSATNTVTIRFNNNNLVAAVDPASGTFRAVVTKY